jgi:hypothetical protein
MYLDGPLIYGCRLPDAPEPEFANMPAGVLKVRLRERCDCETRVFLKFADRIEEWSISRLADGRWNLDFPIGSNRQSKIENRK